MATTEQTESGPSWKMTRQLQVRGDRAIVTRVCNVLAVDMYKQLLRNKAQVEPDRPPDNVVFSPLAVASALSMLLAGARGRTAQQLCAVLGVADHVALHDQFRQVWGQLASLGENVTLHLANALYTDERFVPLPSFRDTLYMCYRGIDVTRLAFGQDPDACRASINARVERDTHSAIRGIVPVESLDHDTVMALISALHFKARWLVPLDPGRSCTGDFHESPSKVVRARMMSGDAVFRLNNDCDGLPARAIDIPFRGSRASMTILVPDQKDGLSQLSNALSPARLARVLSGFDPPRDGQLVLPHFKVRATTNLKAVLQALGVEDLFSPDQTDLSGIAVDGDQTTEDGTCRDARRLVLSVALHGAFLEINEEGAHGVVAPNFQTPGDVIVDPARILVDRPFYFLLRCRKPDVITFAGCVWRIVQ
ncbi:iris-like [Haemaphysalis longicornis]